MTLPSSTPAAQGVDASDVLAFLDAVEAAHGIAPHSLTVLRHDRLVASGWWAPYTPERRRLVYSVSKSFTATAAGIAVDEGLIGLDDPVISYFPELDAEITDPRSRAMLVRHVASMASGHEAETFDRARALDGRDLVRGFLLLPPDRDPGTVFAYNQPATYTLAAILQRVTGQRLTEYLRPRLLDPLGIGEVTWLSDRSGHELGFSGLHAPTDALARLGLLYLREGMWDGERLLSREWVAEATRAQIPTAGAMAGADRSDWDRGYGFQFWRSLHGYRADGAYGQFALVLPEQDAVVALTAATDDMQALLNLVWDHLLPAFRPAPLTGQEQAEATLAKRLTGLALEPAPGEPAPPQRAGDWSDAAFTPSGGTCAGQPTLSRVKVTEGPDGWTLTLLEEGHPLDLRLGQGGGWTVHERPLPVAVGGGWTDADRLTVDVRFLETPHCLRVVCARSDGTFTARWDTVPLHGGPLRSLRASG
ncbi:serine hydrolase domain-containing protein [Streptomyces sp. NPDC018693]|uniref:serine hydrolase domain-containing protein n=1 Tax=unclassified Streptomyces TaxID=2593676 RepID=UPI0037B84443